LILVLIQCAVHLAPVYAALNCLATLGTEAALAAVDGLRCADSS
jgi:hypothetical protein